MRFLQIWFNSLENRPYLTLLFCALGIFFLVVSSRLLRRRREQRQLTRSRVGVMLVALLFGVWLFGSTCYVIARWPPAFQSKWMELVHSDFADAGQLADLQKQEFPAAEAGPAGDDWPQWRGPQRDGVSRGSNLRTDWAARPPREVWRKPIGAGYSSVVVSGGRVVVHDQGEGTERVHCLSEEDGKTLWVHEYDATYAGLWSHPRGPRATPTIHDGRVYVVGAKGKFLCLAAKPRDKTAEVLWEHDLLAEFEGEAPSWGVSCSPLIEENLVIVQPGGVKGSLAAFDRISGKLVWTALDEPSGYSSPVAATVAGVRQIIAFTAEGLAGVRASDGQSLWYYPWKTPHSANVATPIVAGDYVFLSSNYNTGCALLRITAENGAMRADPVYIKRNKLMRNHQSTCVLHGGFLYGFDSRSSNEENVQLRCVDLRTGAERWSTGDVGKGVPLIADGHLLLLFGDGTLKLASASAEGYREKAAFQVFQEKEVWALPALAGGKLYLRSHREVVCLEIGK